MKKSLFLLFALLLSVVTLSLAADFSGSWKLNTSKSKLNEQFSMAPKEIVIVQKGNDLNMERQSSFGDQNFTTKDKLTLDGKECTNPGWMDSQKKSVATLSADGSSLKIISKIPMNDGAEMMITEVYKMDGATMVIESSSKSSFGDSTETMVYDKK